MTELRANFAKALGVSAEGVAKGAGETVKGLGNALKIYWVSEAASAQSYTGKPSSRSFASVCVAFV